jgi:ubiquinone/menaquinone biosynthesis C-methylase UbiE
VSANLTARYEAAAPQWGRQLARLMVGDLDQAQLPDVAVDIVVAAHLLERLPDPAAAIVRMIGLLRPGGLLILSVSRPHWCSHLVWLRWRHRRFQPAEVCDFLRRAGSTDLHCWRPIAGPPRRLSLAYAARRAS